MKGNLIFHEAFSGFWLRSQNVLDVGTIALTLLYKCVRSDT